MNNFDRAMRDLIRAADEPTRIALAMAKAITQHLDDVATDDAGDGDARTLPIIERATLHADALIETLQELVEPSERQRA